MKHLNKLLLVLATVLTTTAAQAADECIKVKSCDYDFKCDVYHYTGDWQLIGVTENQSSESDVDCMSNTLAEATPKTESKLAGRPSLSTQR